MPDYEKLITLSTSSEDSSLDSSQDDFENFESFSQSGSESLLSKRSKQGYWLNHSNSNFSKIDISKVKIQALKSPN